MIFPTQPILCAGRLAQMEIPKMWEWLNENSAALIAVGSMYLGSRLTSRQTSALRISELRREAYGVILSELALVERVFDRADDAMMLGLTQYFCGDSYNRHNTEIATHMSAVRRKFRDDYLVLSDRFIEMMESLFADIQEQPNDDLPEAHFRFARGVANHRPRLIKQARGEMPFKGAWWRSLPAAAAGALNLQRRTREPTNS